MGKNNKQSEHIRREKSKKMEGKINCAETKEEEGKRQSISTHGYTFITTEQNIYIKKDIFYFSNLAMEIDLSQKQKGEGKNCVKGASNFQRNTKYIAINIKFFY